MISRPWRVATVTLAVALLVAPAAASGLVQVDVPTDSTAMDARVAADGDATWTITYRVELSTEDRRTAFEDLEADLAANESAYLDRFRDRMTRTIGSAESATGRAMALSNLSVSTSRTGVPAEYGLLTYRFRWTNFARVEDEELRAGGPVPRCGHLAHDRLARGVRADERRAEPDDDRQSVGHLARPA